MEGLSTLIGHLKLGPEVETLMATVELLVELRPSYVEEPSKQSTLVEVKQLESMWPRSKMVVEVMVDHINLMAEQYRASYLKLRVEEHRGKMKLMAE